MSTLKTKRALLLYPGSLYFPFRLRHGATVASILLHLKGCISEYASVDICDLCQEYGFPQTEEEVKDFLVYSDDRFRGMDADYDLVGISCYTSLCFLAAKEIGRLARMHWPDATIVVGGYHPTAAPEDFIYDGSPFDFVVRGEGEGPLRDIIQDSLKATHLPTIVTGKPLDPQEWADMPFAEYPYPKNMIDLWVNASRGCIMSCRFCCQSGEIAYPWRTKTVPSVLDMVQRAYAEVRPKNIFFSDPYLGVKKGWFKALLRGLIELDLPVAYEAECRVETLDDELTQLMSELRFSVILGIESLSPKMIERMGKARNPERYVRAAIEALHRLSRSNVSGNFQLIMNHPGESVETYQETVRTLWSIIESQEETSLLFVPHSFLLFPGNYIYSHLDEYVRAYGYRVNDVRWWTTTNPMVACQGMASDSLREAYGENYDYWKEDMHALDRAYLHKICVKTFVTRWFTKIETLKQRVPHRDRNRDDVFSRVVRDVYVAHDVFLEQCSPFSMRSLARYDADERIVKKARDGFLQTNSPAVYDRSLSTQEAADLVVGQNLAKHLQSVRSTLACACE